MSTTDTLLSLGPWNPRTLLGAVGVFAVAVGTRHPRVLIVTALSCYAANLANPAVVTLPPVDLRIVGLGLVVYAAMLRGRLPRVRALRRGAFPATFAYLFFGAAFLGVAASFDEAQKGLLGTLFTLLFAWVLVGASTEDEIRRSLHLVTGVMVGLSLVLVAVDPGAAVVQGRWRGFTSNANSLGLVAGLFFLTSPRSQRLWAGGAVVLALLGSASRAAAFSLGLVAGPRLIEGRSRRLRRGVTVMALIVAIPILHAVFFSGDDNSGGGGTEVNNSLARTSNSRIDEWREGIDIVKAHPTTGVGVGSQPDLVSSSVISPLVEIGLPALLPLGLIVVDAARKSRSKLTVFRPIYFYLFVNGIFEMWLFAGGSLIFLVFLVAAYDPGLHEGRRSEPDEDDDVTEGAVAPAQAARPFPTR